MRLGIFAAASKDQHIWLYLIPHICPCGCVMSEYDITVPPTPDPLNALHVYRTLEKLSDNVDRVSGQVNDVRQAVATTNVVVTAMQEKVNEVKEEIKDTRRRYHDGNDENHALINTIDLEIEQLKNRVTNVERSISFIYKCCITAGTVAGSIFTWLFSGDFISKLLGK